MNTSAAGAGGASDSAPSEYIDLGDGRRIRRELQLEAAVRVDGGAYDVAAVARYDEHAGRYLARSVTITGRAGAPVSSDTLRGVRVHELLRDALTSYQGSASAHDSRRLRRLGVAGPTQPTLQAVAAVYRLAVLVDDPPVQRVARVFGITRPTAAAWVARARRDGHLQVMDRRSPSRRPAAPGSAPTLTSLPSSTSSTRH